MLPREATWGESVADSKDDLARVPQSSVSLHAATTHSSLPPWPMDEMEFNAQLPDGGHTQRRQHQQQERHAPQNQREPHPSTDTMNTTTTEQTDTTNNNNNHSNATPPHAQTTQVALTQTQQAALRRAEQSKAGLFATLRGGWVCSHCLHSMPHRDRTVCDVCHTRRHDRRDAYGNASAVAEAAYWQCTSCGEYNDRRRDALCRCCQALRSTTEAESRRRASTVHEKVADEVQAQHIGSVVNTRNRVARWRCGDCSEINSLQASGCRRCGRERFALTMVCGTCAAVRTLTNAAVYKDDAKVTHTPCNGSSDEAQSEHDSTAANASLLGAKLESSTFGLDNRFAPYAPAQRCHHCGTHLHGSQITSASRYMWWCACGVTNMDGRLSCMRCRLPRTIPSASVAHDLLHRQRWDFRDCTMWLCENCDEVNTASRYVVVPDRSTQMPSSSSSRLLVPKKVARLIPGHAHCRRCQSPWHYQVVRDGECWRCACHMVNPREATSCRVCGMPALSEMPVSVISLWTKGDWYCRGCGRQNYRERMRCLCGAVRSDMTGA